MTYELKGGEEVRNGVLFGWTGEKCKRCKGNGQEYKSDIDMEGSCGACAGTGEEWGRMPVQPDDLPTAAPGKTLGWGKNQLEQL